MTNPSRAGRI